MARKVIWAPSAVDYLSESLNYISQASIAQANLVETSLISKIEEAIIRPEKFSRDQFKSNNDGQYRAFETHSFRVAYKYDDKELYILRVRHVKQEPKEY